MVEGCCAEKPCWYQEHEVVNGGENVNDCGSVFLVVNEPRFLETVRLD